MWVGVLNGLVTARCYYISIFMTVILVYLLQLDSLRALVKGSQLTFFQREVLCALIVIEVHARDVTKMLVDENVKNVTDFQWSCQLRLEDV